MIEDAPKPLEPGIYFGLDAEIYHADPALGSSDIRRLYQNPPEYWWRSPHNPDRPDGASKDMAYGQAFHCRLLEGAEAFQARYAALPEKADFEGLLVTADDMSLWLRKKGETPAIRKADRRHQVRARSKSVPIWDQIVEEFEFACNLTGTEPIAGDDIARIEQAAAGIRDNPNIDDLFGDGVGEVTVVWDQHTVRLKCRIDWLRIKPVIDLKTMSPPRDYERYDATVFRAMRYRRHDMQASHLLNGRHAAALHIADGRVFGETRPGRDWLQAVTNESAYWASFIYYQKDGPPVARAYDFVSGQGPLTVADDNWQTAIMAYLQYANRFGLDTPWVNYAGRHRVLMEEVHWT